MADRSDATTRQFLAAYDELSDALFRHCVLRVSDRERAKELTQEVFTKSWEYLRQGNKVLNMRAFLYRTMNNIIIDEYRRRSVKKEESLNALEEIGFEPEGEGRTSVENISESRIVLSALHTLPDLYKTPLTLRYVEELSIPEIADMLEESENTVSVRIHRGLNQLRDALHVTHHYGKRN